MSQYTVVERDHGGKTVALPHIDDIAFTRFPNGDAGVALHNPRGDDYTINLEHSDIVQVNKGRFNLSGAEYVYHTGFPAEDADGPGGYLEDGGRTHEAFQ